MSSPYLRGIEATVDITQGSPDQYSLSKDQMTFSLSGGMSDDTITLGPTGYDYTLGSNVSITGIGVPWTGTSSNTITLDHSWNNQASGKLKLDGPEADIEINGESMIGMLRAIEQRLNILKPNPELESEWAELRELGNAYRTLEDKIQAKMKTWDAIAK